MNARRSLLPLHALLLVAICSQCSSSGEKFVSHVDAEAIVRQNAKNAFEVEFDPQADAQAFKAFDAQVVTGKNRADLAVAWGKQPPLARKGATFLEDRVFQMAIKERKWPKDTPLTELEPTFVQGVHLGVQDFLERR